MLAPSVDECALRVLVLLSMLFIGTIVTLFQISTGIRSIQLMTTRMADLEKNLRDMDKLQKELAAAKARSAEKSADSSFIRLLCTSDDERITKALLTAWLDPTISRVVIVPAMGEFITYSKMFILPTCQLDDRQVEFKVVSVAPKEKSDTLVVRL